MVEAKNHVPHGADVRGIVLPQEDGDMTAWLRANWYTVLTVIMEVIGRLRKGAKK